MHLLKTFKKIEKLLEIELEKKNGEYWSYAR